MIANIVIGAVIFGYAAYALVRYINKSKKGKCAACSDHESFSSPCCSSNHNKSKNTVV
ncbi:FeoB-associated Cys-rich membrane protein [Neobacillus sp. PS3-12]|jgi:hypothetical protein|uniref:FeoB-associated Cys-rich membrane protein n=1 Tax=Neobacillus sp. PS3-12 TaxID=3070677 RepID=UPI0027DFCF47|nr:FeoB-associated Cys-rich membrane protein [Neobacillus sp. PS3-12]WML51485.1 FeoB-associated Cys-rich membrane protein [Neobacillus sp. PS3-12]